MSPGRAWRSVSRNCWPQFRCLRLQRRCASEPASESLRISGALPFLAASAGCSLVSLLGRSLLGGLETLSVGPITARFLLLPFEAPEMSFSISSEMNQVIRAGPVDGGGGRGRSQTANWGMARSGAGCREEDAPSCGRCRRRSLGARSRSRAALALPVLLWLPDRVSGQGRARAASESAGVEEAGREEREVFARGVLGGLGQDAARGPGMTSQKEGAGISVPAVKNRCPVLGSAQGLDSLP